MKILPSLDSLGDLKGKRVIVRASLDAPIEDGVVTNDFRIKKALPTIEVLKERGASVVLLTHVGRDEHNTTLPIYNALLKYIELDHIEAVVGNDVRDRVASLGEGKVILLGNLRAHKEEENNDETFASTLASYGDFYVNDAFAVSHRAHASIVGIPKNIPSAAGVTFLEEYENLSKALMPEHPSLFILGGAKFETKEPLITQYAESYDAIALGGALANDFLKAKGCEVGGSLVSPIDLSGNVLMKKENILIPIDVVVHSESGDRSVKVEEIRADESILDIGTESIEVLKPRIQSARTILWNGPLGYYEGGYDKATKACAELIAESTAFSIVGGGDTVAAIESLGLQDKFSFISTAGGAMLEFLEKGTLIGIKSLE